MAPLVDTIWDWSEDEPVRLRLQTGPVGNSFPMPAAAEGHQLWLREEPFDLLDSLMDLAGWKLPGSQVSLPRPLLYVLDEPERHLHPAVQPSAARWLSDTVRIRESQAVVTTHAVPFVNLGAGTAYSYISRAPDGYSRLDSMDVDRLTALSDEAAELGLNRGQLLATVNVVLFVEGRADQIVMECLFGPRLREMGIAISPLSGAGKHAQIFDSDLLIRFTTAKLALMLDNLLRDEVRLLKRGRGRA